MGVIGDSEAGKLGVQMGALAGVPGGRQGGRETASGRRVKSWWGGCVEEDHHHHGPGRNGEGRTRVVAVMSTVSQQLGWMKGWCFLSVFSSHPPHRILSRPLGVRVTSGERCH